MSKIIINKEKMENSKLKSCQYAIVCDLCVK